MQFSLHAFAPLVLPILLLGCSGNSDGVIESSGTIEGTDINVGVEVAGKVKSLRVDEGSRVSNGDTLLLVDDTDYQIQLRQALANLAAFESGYRLALEGSRQEDVIQAEAAYKSAETDFDRMKALLVEHSVTQKNYDDAYARYVAAEQTYRKLQRGLRPVEIEGARVRRDLAAAQADLLKKKVHDCIILSPANATVTLRGIEPGELVAPGMTVLRLTYLDRVKLVIYVNETELGLIRLGESAQVRIDAFPPGKSIEAKVTYISPVAEFTPKNVQTKEERTKLVFGVKLEMDNPDQLLKPGLPADARLVSAVGKAR